MVMAKAEIISKIVNDEATSRSKRPGASADYSPYSEGEIVASLQASLKKVFPHEPVRTCEDFSHFRVECCETCHHFDPQFEMAIVDIETGGLAWICCALDRALNPAKTAERENSPEWKEISKVFKGDAVD
jgi:hypothetical protein